MSPKAPAAAAGGIALKVTVGDTWNPVTITASASDTVTMVKAQALAAFNRSAAMIDAYEVKLGGARVRTESRTLEQLGIVTGSSMIVLARRRRPVR